MGESDARLGHQPRLAALESTHRPHRFPVDANESANPAHAPAFDELQEPATVVRSLPLSPTSERQRVPAACPLSVW